MSVCVFWELNTPVCDDCGMRLLAEKSVEDAHAAMEREGWASRESGAGRVDVCPVCRREGAPPWRKGPGPEGAAP